MKIKKLIVDNKYVAFSHRNLINSSENSVGKTTLIRLILFAMGFAIPSTQKVNFNNLITRIYIENNSKNYLLIRSKDSVKIYEDDSYIETFNVRVENEIGVVIFGITNNLIINNILATFYFDQEKGWTLLNRGTVIGGIKFNIEEYLEGMSQNELGQYRQSVLRLNKDIAFYSQLKKLIEINDDRERKVNDFNWSDVKNKENQIRTIDLDIEQTESQISQLKEVRNDNQKVMRMVDSLNLVVRTDSGDSIIVSKDNVENFKINTSILDIRISSLNKQLDKKKALKNELQSNLQNIQLFNMESRVDKFKESVKNLNMTPQSFELILKDLRAKRRELNQKIKNIMNDSNLANELYSLIIKYSEVLGVKDYIDETTDFILTSNLKRYSGAVLHLIVFAYRMALLKLLERHLKVKPPIIIDSPLSGELDEENVNKMFELLKNEFDDYQLIVASINDLKNIAFNWDDKITIHNTLFESINLLNEKIE
jgi:hypothetical protein